MSTCFWFPFALCAASAMASAITYNVTVNTSSISGAAGSLDFNFNPGPLVTQSASIQILGFTAEGTLAGTPTLTGDVSGALPGTLTFDNGSGFNDYFDGFTFGGTLSFNLSLFGPALSAPDGASTSGSTFAFSMFSDAAGAIPTLTSNTTDGFAFTVDVTLDGTTTVTNFSPQTGVVPATSPGSPVPEPSTVSLLAVPLGLIGALVFWQRRRRFHYVFRSTSSECVVIADSRPSGPSVTSNRCTNRLELFVELSQILGGNLTALRGTFNFDVRAGIFLDEVRVADRRQFAPLVGHKNRRLAFVEAINLHRAVGEIH